MKKILEYVNNKNLYGLFFKILGIGYQFIGIALMFKNNYPILYIILGMCTGLIFIAFGEIINMLDKIYKKVENKNESSSVK